MCMCVCTHGQQTGGEEINQIITFVSQFCLQTIRTTLDKPP